jgi:hypothetical protein
MHSSPTGCLDDKLRRIFIQNSPYESTRRYPQDIVATVVDSGLVCPIVVLLSIRMYVELLTARDAAKLPITPCIVSSWLGASGCLRASKTFLVRRQILFLPVHSLDKVLGPVERDAGSVAIFAPSTAARRLASVARIAQASHHRVSLGGLGLFLDILIAQSFIGGG